MRQQVPQRRQEWVSAESKDELADKFKELFEEVQRSNMSKACDNEEEAAATVQYYKENRNTECYYKQVDGKYLVFRTEDNKTIKSVNYSPANLKDILNK